MKVTWKKEKDMYVLHMPKAKLKIFFDSWNTNARTPWQWTVIWHTEQKGCKVVSGNSKTLKQAKIHAMQLYTTYMEN